MESSPKPERKLSTEEIQDAQMGLYKWHIEILENEKKEREEAYSIEPLTRLKTRKAFWDEFTYSLEMIRGEVIEQRKGVEPIKEVSVVMIDLDHFKVVNDTFGHPAGDEVLRRVSALLIESVRPTDTVARFGGEELIVLMRDTDIQVAARQIEKIREKIQNLTFEAYPALKVTASFGIASSKTSTNPETLVAQADKALYEAKGDKDPEGNGRNRVKVYNET